MIEPIAAPVPPQAATLRPPEALQMRAALSGARRFIVHFAPDTPLPDSDEIACTTDALEGIIPGHVLRSLGFSEATAWLGRLYPGGLGAELDAQAARHAQGSPWSDASRPGFSRYYCLRFTGGLDDGYIIGTLMRAATIDAVQPEFKHVLSASAVTHAEAGFAQQDYLQAAPNGISVEAAWDAGAGGAGISIGFADAGFAPSNHSDIKVRHELAAGAFDEHMLAIAGVLASEDNKTGIVGVSPQSPLVFSAVNVPDKKGAPTTPLSKAHAALALLLKTPHLAAGDVVNLSVCIANELDQAKRPELAAAIARAVPKARGKKLTITTGVPLEIDASMLELIRQLTNKGITVCQAAGNGWEAGFQAAGKQLVPQKTGVGADLALPWVDDSGGAKKGNAVSPSHTLDRSNTASFKDGGSIVVSGAVLTPSPARVPGFNFGNRVDCFAKGLEVVTWSSGGLKSSTGTSMAAPIVAGAAALIQSFALKRFGATLRPRVMRALLGDPMLNTLAPVGNQIGAMPDLAKIFEMFQKRIVAKEPDKARTNLMYVLQAQAIKSQYKVENLLKAAASATPPVTWVHDPYTEWNETTKEWKPMPLQKETDIFNPPP